MIDDFGYKKSLGQNFLIDDNVVSNIANCIEYKKSNMVIEIGPGSGNLTKKILEKADFALLYEVDCRLKAILRKELMEYNNYEIIWDDFLSRDIKADLVKYNYNNIYVVANLPYYITTPIISKFILEMSNASEIVIMVQKEMADRLSAEVGTRDYGQLTVFINYYFEMSKMFDVDRKCFYPSPNVDSAVIKMTRRDNLDDLISFDHFERLVKTAFQFKRKTIKNNLLKKYDLEIINRVLEKYGFDLSARSEKIPYYVFVEMSNELLK